MKFISNIKNYGDVWGAPDGALSLVLAAAAQTQAPIIFVARDDARLAAVEAGLRCIAPQLGQMGFASVGLFAL